MIDDGSWRDDANCYGVDTEIFFPKQGGTSSDAIRICDACRVKVECLTAELEFEEQHRRYLPYGIFGGMTGIGRARLLGRQR